MLQIHVSSASSSFYYSFSLLYFALSLVVKSLLFVLLLFFLYTLYCLCMLYTVPLISSSGHVHSHILPTCITIEKACYLLCSAYFPQLESSARSSCKLFIFPGYYDVCFHHQWLLSKDYLASLVVILNLFITGDHYPKILWILWQSQFFVFFASYSQSFLASLAFKPLPSCDHRWCPYTYSKCASRSWSSEC
jgi:hypothetical protein